MARQHHPEHTVRGTAIPKICQMLTCPKPSIGSSAEGSEKLSTDAGGLQDLSELQKLPAADVTTLLQDVPPPQGTTHAHERSRECLKTSLPTGQRCNRFDHEAALPDFCTLGLLQPATIAIVMSSYTS